MTEYDDASQTTRTATVIIAVVLMGAVVWWLRDILAPLALALFLMVIIDGLARVLQHRIPRFPRAAALPLSMFLTTLAFGLTVYIAVDNAGRFFAQLLAESAKLNGLVGTIGAQLGVPVPKSLNELVAQINIPQYLTGLANGLKSLASGATLVLIYLIFLFISRHGFEQKAQQLFHSAEKREQAQRIFVRIRTGVERYVWVQTITAVIIAGASWTVMTWIGLNDAIFWAFLIFLASYVPILGGAIGILLPPIFALVQFGMDWKAPMMLVCLETIHMVVGNFVAPRMQGVTLNVDPVVVVLSLAFWGAIWGVPGMFLSTPLTVVAVVILIQFPSTRWIAVLLSRDGYPQTYSEGPSDPSEPAERKPKPRRRNASVKPEGS